ncbi:MAG: NAD-dependent epimerase/dehydratase family protein [Bryobacteraceae bacterium]
MLPGFWSDRACLVTGGAGFGGSHLCEQLLDRKARVYVLDQHVARNSYLRLSGNIDRVADILQGDVRDLDLAVSILHRHDIDTVFHAAAQPIVPLSRTTPLYTLSVNVMGTAVLLEASRQAGAVKNFVFASSGGYYGTTWSRIPMGEEVTPLASRNIYATSKTAADVIVRSYFTTYGVNTVCCRFMNTYGPGDTHFSRIIPTAIKHLILGNSFEFDDRFGGSTELDYLHVRDMSLAYIAAAENLATVKGQAVNFGSGESVSSREIAVLISRLFDGKTREPMFPMPTGTDSPAKSLDITKARDLLQWTPKISLEDGLRETIEWYRRNWHHI